MDHRIDRVGALTAAVNLEELLRTFPVAAQVFIRHRMACVGCEVARFESLAEACQIYGKDPEKIAAEIRAVIGDAHAPTE